jgi:hypothetical protein
VCAGIRSATAIDRYAPEVTGWGAKYMVTLTIPNCRLDDLRTRVKGMLTEFSRVTQWLQRKHGRPAVKVLRSLEVTFNQTRYDAHPHFHCLVEGEQVARDMVERWLHRHPEASAAAQDVRAASNTAVLEVFKYAVGLSVDKRGADGTRAPVPAPALDGIYRALRGVRLLGAVGFSALLPEDEPMEDAEMEDGALTPEGETISPVKSDKAIVWEWSQEAMDWVNPETGELLTGYKPSKRVIDFIKKLEESP